MKISLQGIAEQRQWEEKGYSLPKYDMQKVARAAKEILFGFTLGRGICFVHFMLFWYRICWMLESWTREFLWQKDLTMKL